MKAASQKIPIQLKSGHGAFWVNFLGTSIFCSLVLYVATAPNAGSFAPVAVGLGVYAVIMFFIDVSGAVINPAVASGMFLTGTIHSIHARFSVFCVYIFAELAGGALAGFLTKLRLGSSSTTASTEDVDQDRSSTHDFKQTV